MLSEGWTLTLTEPDAYQTPVVIPLEVEAVTAPVPGTVAQALEVLGKFDRLHPKPLNIYDAWYRLTLISDSVGSATLRFEGLATIADIFLNGERVAQSTSMFEALDIPFELTGADELAICFRALAPRLEKPGPRARWRPQMMNSQGLRLIRTTALGHMPGWCREIHAVGPWRPVRLIRDNERAFDVLSSRSELDTDGTGVLHFSARVQREASTIEIMCAGRSARLEPRGDGVFEGALRLDTIEPWWPATHGKPGLHDVSLRIDGRTYHLGKTGFRRIEIDHGTDGKGFGVTINGEPIFCRGAVWTNADIVRLPGAKADYEPWLRLAAEAGMNMIRIGGTMTYETPDFFALCDELGIMVWQDMMLANFDYPAKDEAFLAHIETEISQLLTNTALSPSLTVLCGGSEIYQQGAMLGLSEQFWKGPLTEEILPAHIRRLRPDIAYVPNSPFGGALPFFPNEKVGHYYGVGAYCRPLEDARRADVRFAAECLAFANVPQQRTLDKHLPAKPVHDPQWKARVPRDRGASWDFEDIRDHYLKLLYDIDPPTLRREDGERYLDLSRAVTAEVMEATFAEWRRTGSSCQGALVWTLQDLLPGPGWGVIDATGEPKAAWYGLKRAFRPLHINLLDEGTNGLDIHLINETPDMHDVVVEITCLRDGLHPVVTGKHALSLASRQKQVIAATDLFGAFFDTTYAYRFGPPSHNVTVARLIDADTGALIANAFHFPRGRQVAMHAATLRTEVSLENENWIVQVTADRFAQSVHFDAEGFRPSDDWFHLAPGEARTVELRPTGPHNSQAPKGEIRTLGSNQVFRF
ncbi:beta-mannosidase [Agrobacterium rubi]|uniref:beta-mannosidase n=1 Tax=Agrobacterium rubi TaxID=28099 RepID=A0AAE7R430_9HYPH|nr:glycoside hydrolase family 2 protein [Agrobacterium rubi]NTE87331.1 glycoside hydrolase family 2 protein [Agrobacterium rubi]NTF03638.1 glycoside hydrolase family 2 protein [Agrobacterium rubi]NTF37797.1 glycoside hydrolase family 2 protein [Agrobacterium rubi]OCJ45533.1 beta-mannosidase [Agrobacterium rubi]QTG01575.1 glycoside hydrolase family 2 protein [Agrobacterium rubi]